MGKRKKIQVEALLTPGGWSKAVGMEARRMVKHRKERLGVVCESAVLIARSAREKTVGVICHPEKVGLCRCPGCGMTGSVYISECHPCTLKRERVESVFAIKEERM